MNWEFTVLNWITENLHSDFWTPVLRFITTLGDGGILWIALALILLIPRRSRQCGFAMALSLLFCGLCGNVILKPLVARIRPYDVNTAVQLLIPRLPDFSFPSGHTYASFAGACVLLHYYRKAGICAFILAVLIAFSRLYFYVHYPTDVLAGLLMGIGFAVLSIWLVHEFLWKRLPARFTGSLHES